MNLQDVYKKLVEDIHYLFTCATETMKFDRTFRAKVIGPASKGKYIISYKNRTLTARFARSLQPNDTVWVCAPCNDWNSLFIQVTEPQESS